jgi:transposase
VSRSERYGSVAFTTGGYSMTQYVGLDVSQKLTAICIVDDTGRRVWRGQCASDPEQIERVVRRHADGDARIGIETGPMTPWLVHALRGRGLEVTCLDARHARAALKMQINKTDQNDAEGLAQIMRTGWYRSVHVKSFDSHRARALLGARVQLVGMTTRLSNHIRGVLKTFGLLPGSMRGVPFDRRVEAMLADRDDIAPIIRPMLVAWRQLRQQVVTFDKAVRRLVKSSPACRHLIGVPGIGVLSALAFVSISKCGDTLARTLMYEAAVVLMTRVKRTCGLKDWAQAIATRSGAGKARVALARKLSVIMHSIWRSGEPFRWSEQLVVA